MELRINGHRLELYPKTMVGKMSMNSLESRSTTFQEIRRGRRTMTVPDKRFYLRSRDRDRYIFASNQYEDIKTFLTNNDVKFSVETVERDYTPIRTNISIKDGMKLRDDIQRTYSTFLDQRLGSVLCSLQTGKGKTGSTIISLLKRKPKNRIAILLSPRYNDTWIEALNKFTDVKKENILIISGRDSLYNIKDISDEIEVVIISPVTLRSFVKAYLEEEEVPFAPDKIMEYIGSEDLIIDEVHEDFAGNYLNVLALNPKRYIALTASYSSKSDSDRIKKFKKIFVPHDNRLPEPDFDRYVNIVFCQYRLDDPQKVQHKNDYMGWYNHHVYEDSILSVKDYKESYFKMIVWFAKQYYDNKHRALFLMARVSMCHEFREWLIENKVFEGKVITVYADKNKHKDNLKDDIIISTSQSGGTGIDIINLQTTINTINVGSDYSCIQYSGRNRKMKDTEQYFLSLMATNIPAHMTYMKSNREIYEDRAKELLLNYYNVSNVCIVKE